MVQENFRRQFRTTAVPDGHECHGPGGDADQQFIGVFVVDPNSSPVDSLELLPGIGPVLADRIVSYRQNQPFETEIDITEVKGIGPKLYERIKPYLKVRR